jgi:hypothetical protein
VKHFSFYPPPPSFSSSFVVVHDVIVCESEFFVFILLCASVGMHTHLMMTQQQMLLQ